mgnify:CR=1 FL=1
MNDTRVRCACEVRQHYLCKILRIPWKFFQRINIFCILLIVDSFIIYYKHFTTLCSSCIQKSVQPECLDQKATDRNFLNRYIYPSDSRGAIKTNMATKCFYKFMSALRSEIYGVSWRSAKDQ